MAASEIEPLKCALRFKPPTLVLLYKNLETGKTRKRSIPIRGLTAETSLPSYTTQLLHNPRHAPYLTKIPQNQLESLLQRVQDALHPVLHTTTTPSHSTPSHIHTSLIDAPPLSFTAKLSHEEEKREKGGRKSILDENFQSALTELLGGGSDKDGEAPPPDRRGPSANTTVQSEPSKTTSDLTSTNTLYGRKLPPLGSGSHDDDHGRSGDTVEATVIKTKQLDALSSLVSIEQRRRETADEKEGVRQPHTSSDCPSSSLPNASLSASGSQQKSNKPPSVAGTFPTEVPDYSADFSSDSEALSSPIARQGREQSPADKSLSIPSHLSFSGTSLGGLSVDQDFNHLSSDSLGRELGGVITGENSEEEDLNKANDEQLAKRKAQMDVLFEANRLQPGDKGYVYDKEVEFGQPKIESGWDSEEESSNEF